MTAEERQKLFRAVLARVKGSPLCHIATDLGVPAPTARSRMIRVMKEVSAMADEQHNLSQCNIILENENIRLSNENQRLRSAVIDKLLDR